MAVFLDYAEIVAMVSRGRVIAEISMLQLSGTQVAEEENDTRHYDSVSSSEKDRFSAPDRVSGYNPFVDQRNDLEDNDNAQEYPDRYSPDLVFPTEIPARVEDLPDYEDEERQAQLITAQRIRRRKRAVAGGVMRRRRQLANNTEDEECQIPEPRATKRKRNVFDANDSATPAKQQRVVDMKADEDESIATATRERATRQGRRRRGASQGSSSKRSRKA